jgi:ATP-dependent RNA helicase DeaD
MTIEFSELDLQPQLVDAVSALGYINPTPIQAETIPIMLSGRDVIAQAQTGTGKTAAFALPILQKLEQDRHGIQALVLAPTRELAMQVAQATSEYGSHLDVSVLAVYGGQSYSRQIGRLRQGVDIVVGTPGRLLDLIHKGEIDLSTVKTIVLDEADEMLSMGFIDDIEEILSTSPAERQTALFSATIPANIKSIAKKYMQSPQSVTIQSKHLTVDSIDHRYCLVNEKDKLAVLTRLFELEDITSALIFVRTRLKTSDLVNELMGRGFPAEALNGDLVQETREQVLNRFRRKQSTVLVATDMAARGLDIDDISHVFNYDLPLDPELYVHRVGRTARAGKTGIAISLVTRDEQWRLHRIEGFSKQPITRVTVPTVQQIEQHRQAQLQEQMLSGLKRDDCQKELQLVASLIEMGYEPSQVAAAALKIIRGEEKQRPIAPLSEVRENHTPKIRSEIRPARKDNRRRASESPAEKEPHFSVENGPHPTVEKGMVRLTLNVGKSQGVRPADVVGTIAYHANFPGHAIGGIKIMDKYTLVDVPQQYAAQTLAKAGKYRIRKAPVKLEIA